MESLNVGETVVVTRVDKYDLPRIGQIVELGSETNAGRVRVYWTHYQGKDGTVNQLREPKRTWMKLEAVAKQP